MSMRKAKTPNELNQETKVELNPDTKPEPKLETDLKATPEPNQEPGPELVDSNNPPALAAGEADRQPRKRRRRSREEIEAERRAEQTATMEQATATARVVIPALARALAQFLPPPLLPDEQEALVGAWTPVIAEYGGDLPPIAAAIVVTLAVFTPRLYARVTGHDAPGTGIGQERYGENNAGAPAR
jgi:hypothetical protein